MCAEKPLESKPSSPSTIRAALKTEVARTLRRAPEKRGRAREGSCSPRRLTGVSLHCGLIAPPVASQAFVPGDAHQDPFGLTGHRIKTISCVLSASLHQFC